MRLLFVIAAGLVAACGGEDDPADIAIHTRASDAPAWAVPYGAEFWHPPHGVDVQDAISRVSHAFRGGEARSAGYAARVDDGGLRVRFGASELRLHTRVNGRDSRGVPWSIVGDTAQGLLAPGIVEHDQARDEGVEVSWVFAERGPIEIEASFDGLVPDEDLHFVDGSGTRVAKLSAATLVDHAGHRWPVTPELDGSVVRYHVGADVIASAEFPVALDPVIGPERTPDAPVIGGAPGLQTAPSVASNGTVSLVVWQDSRTFSSSIWGARVSPQGVVLDPSGIAIAESPDGQKHPGVASNGTDFLVTWADGLASSSGNVYVARVDGSGTVLDPGGVRVAYARSTSDPAVASNGADYLVAWTDSSNRLAASRVTAAGVVLDTDGFFLSTRPTAYGDVSLASVGVSYLAVWSENPHGAGGDIVGTRVSDAGTVLDPLGIPIATGTPNQSSVAVTANHSDYLVAWDDLQDVYATRVTAAGTVVAPNGVALGSGRDPAVASDGAGFLVTWPYVTTTSKILGAKRITATGAVLDSEPIVVTTRHDAALYSPAIAFDGARYLVAWSYDQPEADIQASRVGSDGTVTTPVLVSTAPVAQGAPAIAASANEFLAAWTDRRAGDDDLYVARLSSTGVPLDPSGVLVSASGATASPSVASNGTDFLVTWVDLTSPGVYAARVTAAGMVGTQVTLATGPTASVAASDGSDYFVAWQGAPATTIQGIRVAANGSIVGSPVTIASGTTPLADPAIAWGLGQYLVAWTDSTPTHHIVAARVSATGQVLDPPFAVSPATSDQQRPAVAASDSGYLIVWEDGHVVLEEVFGTRISADGDVLDPDPLPISTSTINHAHCTVASSGSEYVVAWDVIDGGWTIGGVRLSLAGELIDELTIPTPGAAEPQPHLVYSEAASAYLVAYRALGHVHDRWISFHDCGDGQIDLAETCDDGGHSGGDGCSASCAVEPGYACTGAPSICADIDECAIDNGGCAQTCTNTTGGFTCSCGPGYVLDANGRTCDTTDANECAYDNGGCEQACTNTAGGFTCSCGSGYTLGADGTSCSDIDECATNNGGCPETCANTFGSFRCLCSDGYAYDAATNACEDIDECATNNGDCTQICTNLAGSHECSCQPGFWLAVDGAQCVDINECAKDAADCSRYALCANTIGSYTCTCDEGYEGDGITCKPVKAPGGGCSTTDAHGSWLLVLACLWFLGRRRREIR